MRIRISERTRVHDSVKDFIVDTAEQKIRAAMRQHNPRYPDRSVLQNAQAWQRMAVGDVDRIIGTLHGLPYTKIEAIHYNKDWYLSGVTKEIVMQTFQGDRAVKPSAERNIGQYMVCIPQKDFLNGTYSSTHLIPLRDQLIRARHPHHTAFWSESETGNPLDMTPRTCSGGFGSIALTLMKALDFPETMRTWFIFLGRHNPNSPLTAPAPFMEFLRYL